jgi:hypothetical protein
MIILLIMTTIVTSNTIDYDKNKSFILHIYPIYLLRQHPQQIPLN